MISIILLHRLPVKINLLAVCRFNLFCLVFAQVVISFRNFLSLPQGHGHDTNSGSDTDRDTNMDNRVQRFLNLDNIYPSLETCGPI
jgi:hypothetical protein